MSPLQVRNNRFVLTRSGRLTQAFSLYAYVRFHTELNPFLIVLDILFGKLTKSCNQDRTRTYNDTTIKGDITVLPLRITWLLCQSFLTVTLLRRYEPALPLVGTPPEIVVSRYLQFFYLKTQRVLSLKSQFLLGGEENLPSLFPTSTL